MISAKDSSLTSYQSQIDDQIHAFHDCQSHPCRQFVVGQCGIRGFHRFHVGLLSPHVHPARGVLLHALLHARRGRPARHHVRRVRRDHLGAGIFARQSRRANYRCWIHGIRGSRDAHCNFEGGKLVHFKILFTS